MTCLALPTNNTAVCFALKLHYIELLRSQTKTSVDVCVHVYWYIFFFMILRRTIKMVFLFSGCFEWSA